MKQLGGIGLGTFRPGNSWLHRFDPRGKLLLLPLLIAASFSAAPPALLCLAIAAMVVAETAGIGFLSLLRGLRPVRWLLLATLLLHLVFSPGRTFPLIDWLSYDGLLLGLVTAGQLLLAMVFACLLSATTEPVVLADALSALLRPLNRVGVPARRLAELLGLTLHFVPLLREEGAVAWRKAGQRLDELKRGPLLERGRAAARLVEPLIVNLANHAEVKAIAMARGEPLVSRQELMPMRGIVKLQVLGCYLLLSGLIWL